MERGNSNDVKKESPGFSNIKKVFLVFKLINLVCGWMGMEPSKNIQFGGFDKLGWREKRNRELGNIMG